jgi:hypothetical protein
MITIEMSKDLLALFLCLGATLLCIIGLIGRYWKESDALFGLFGGLFAILTVTIALVQAIEAGMS